MGFAKKKETFASSVEGNVKCQWLTTDACMITYQTETGALKGYLATFGDRGNGISYYNVAPAILGDWQMMTQNEEQVKVSVDSNGITVTKNKQKEIFPHRSCQQYGTIGIVLKSEEIPKYVIVLNQDCKLDDKTNLVKKGGTITLCEVSMGKTVPKELSCVTYKNEKDLTSYQPVSVEAGKLKQKNEIWYFSYDGKEVLLVPNGIIPKNSTVYENICQIKEEKTVIAYTNHNKSYLALSEDTGDTWETVEIGENKNIQQIEFVNQANGFLLEFEDMAMGTAFGKILRTSDGGKTWETVCDGMGEGEYKIFKRGSKMAFITSEVGFVTMPTAGEEMCDLYRTENGGKTFKKVTVKLDKTYDFYHLPKFEEGNLILQVTQGTDGDGKSPKKEYISYDFGKTWEIL